MEAEKRDPGNEVDTGAKKRKPLKPSPHPAVTKVQLLSPRAKRVVKCPRFPRKWDVEFPFDRRVSSNNNNNYFFQVSSYLALRHTNWRLCKLKLIQITFNQMRFFEERGKPLRAETSSHESGKRTRATLVGGECSHQYATTALQVCYWRQHIFWCIRLHRKRPVLKKNVSCYFKPC